MSQWTDRIEASGVLQSLVELVAVLSEAHECEDLDTADVEALDRLQSVCRYLKKLLDKADPHLIVQGPLDQMVQQLQACLTNVQHFMGNGNTSHLQNANNVADRLLNLAAQFPSIPPEDGLEGLRESVTGFRRSASQLMRHLEGEVQGFDSKLEARGQKLQELATQIEEQRGQISRTTSEFQQQFSQAQQDRMNQADEARQRREQEFRQFLGEREKELEAALRENTEAVQSTVEAILETQKEFSEVRKEAMGGFQEEAKSIFASTRAGADSLVADINKSKEQAERLLAVIGEVGATSGYQKAADRAWKVGWFWHGVTVLSLIGIFVLAWGAFLPLVTGEYSWASFAGRVFVTLTAAALAAYAAHQADKQGRIERENRRIELDLAGIGPYLAEMPEETSKELKKILAERVFGRKEGLGPLKGDQSPVTALEVILKSNELRSFIQELVTAVVKAAKP